MPPELPCFPSLPMTAIGWTLSAPAPLRLWKNRNH